MQECPCRIWNDVSDMDDLRTEISILGRNYLRSFCLITCYFHGNDLLCSAASHMYYECIVCVRDRYSYSLELLLAWDLAKMAAAEFKSLHLQLLSEDEMQELLDGTASDQEEYQVWIMAYFIQQMRDLVTLSKDKDPWHFYNIKIMHITWSGVSKIIHIL